MAEKRSIPKFLWKHKILTAAGAAGLGMWVAFHSGGGGTTPPAETNTAPVVQPGRETGGEWANRDPRSKHLACALLLKKAGVNYSLQTYITEGTPPPDATVTYSPKYQGGLSHGFASHRTGPTAIPWQHDALIPNADQGVSLASVRGSIGAVSCAPAVPKG